MVSKQAEREKGSKLQPVLSRHKTNFQKMSFAQSLCCGKRSPAYSFMIQSSNPKTVNISASGLTGRTPQKTLHTVQEAKPLRYLREQQNKTTNKT